MFAFLTIAGVSMMLTSMLFGESYHTDEEDEADIAEERTRRILSTVRLQQRSPEVVEKNCRRILEREYLSRRPSELDAVFRAYGG